MVNVARHVPTKRIKNKSIGWNRRDWGGKFIISYGKEKGKQDEDKIEL